MEAKPLRAIPFFVGANRSDLNRNRPMKHPSAPTPPTSRIVRIPEASKRIGLSRASIYRLMAIGAFPKALKLSERAIG